MQPHYGEFWKKNYFRSYQFIAGTVTLSSTRLELKEKWNDIALCQDRVQRDQNRILFSDVKKFWFRPGEFEHFKFA